MIFYQNHSVHSLFNFLKKKKILLVVFFFYSYRFIDSLFWFHPFDVSTDSDTHWAYLAATTFDFIDTKWDFPKFVYGPWYYFFTAYTFGPLFFSAYYFGLITVHEAAMYSFLSSNYVLSLIFLIGTFRLSEKLFKKKISRDIYFLLVTLLPFANKNFYNYTVENLILAFMPWIILYIFKAIELNKINHWIKLSFFLSLAASSKISILIPCLILIFGFSILYLLINKKFLYNFFIPILFTLIMVLASNFITKSSLFVNYDAGNVERNYPGLKNYSVFYKADLIDSFNNPLFPNQKYSWINMWSLDFFGDYFGTIKSKHRHSKKTSAVSVENNLNRVSLIITPFFIIWYFFCLFKTISKKLFTYGNFISIFFFAIFFEQVAYCFAVFNPELANSFDMRYWVFYIFFLTYPIAKYVDKLESKKYKIFHWYITIFLCLLSLNQMMLIFI